MDFTDARHTARMSRKEVAQYLEISPRTIKRYEAGQKPPKAIIECLKMIGGEMPKFGLKRNGFEGWSLSNGYLYTDSGERFTSGDRELIKEIRKENKRIKEIIKEKEKEKKTNVIKFPKSGIKRKLG